MSLQINEFAKAIYENAVIKGFYQDIPSIPTRLALIHAEVSEALEADRKGVSLKKDELLKYQSLLFEAKTAETHEHAKLKFAEADSYFETHLKSTFEMEIADIIIRCFDLCGYLNIDIEECLKLKHNYNSRRPYMHGKKY